MKIIHTSDLHIGRSFFGLDLIEDQRHILFQILDIVREKKAQVLVLAGDIYDRSQPAVDAVSLFQDFLNAASALAQVIVIPGNHDSSIRLDFASRWLRENGIWMISRREDWSKTLDVDDVRFYCQPWLEASAGAIGSSQAALDQWLAEADLECKQKKVFVGHFFAKGGSASESERPLCVGGLDEVDSNSLSGFDYCALGHLHRTQKIAKNIRYSGSPLAYGFDESLDKSVLLVDTQRFDIETIALTPLRKARKIRGDFADLLSQAAVDPNREDFLQAELTDKGRVDNPMPELRKFYPNLVHVFRHEEIRSTENAAPRWATAKKMDLAELFVQFLESTQPEAIEPQLQVQVESACVEAQKQEVHDETTSA